MSSGVNVFVRHSAVKVKSKAENCTRSCTVQNMVERTINDECCPFRVALGWLRFRIPPG